MKNKIIIKTIELMLISLLILTSGLLLYSLMLFKDLEKIYMIIGIIIIIYIVTIVSYFINKYYKNRNYNGFLRTAIVAIIFSAIFGILGYFIYSVYGKISDFNKNYITYSTSLITFDSSITEIKNVKNLKIGIIKNEEDVELYQLPQEVISKYSLKKNNEYISYNSVVDLINALYLKEVDAIFINGNYKSLFEVLDEYSNIDNDAIDIINYSKKIKKEKTESSINLSNTKKLTEPFTILLLGVDSTIDGLDKNAAFNGDTIMLITFNPKTLNATMFSIPRDTYVKISCGNGQLAKINSSAYGGSSCVIKTVENMTGIDIDYYAKINFKGVVDLVDALGGITVDVPYKFCEQNSKRQWGKNIIYLESGVQKLNGEEALALSRNRKTHSECSKEWNKEGIRNDFVRGQNQQLVIEGILNKIKTIKTTNKLVDILDIISKNIDTNLNTDQILSFYDVIKTVISSRSIDIVNIQKTLLTGYDMNLYEEPSGYRYAFFNWKGSLKDIVSLMKANLDGSKGKVIKKFSFSAKKPYEQTLVGSGAYNEDVIPVVPNFVSYTITQAINWGQENDIIISVIDKDTNEEITTNYSDYVLFSQSVHQNILLSKVNGEIKLYYIKNITNELNNQQN